MPIIQVPEFTHDRLSHYRNLKDALTVLVILIPLVLLALPILAHYSETNPTEKFGDVFGTTMALLIIYHLAIGWYPIRKLTDAYKHFLHFSQPADIAIHTMEFTPSLKDQPPVVITMSFQWPRDFEQGYPP